MTEGKGVRGDDIAFGSKDTAAPEMAAYAPKMPLLTVKNVTKSFSGVRVLHSVSLSLNGGEVLGIIGENGAGKSTLLKIVAGLYEPDAGSVEMDGWEAGVSDASAAGAKITMVQQEINLVENLDVFENIFLGRELKGLGGLLDKKAMRLRALELLDRFKAGVSPNGKIDELNLTQKRIVEFAKVLSAEPRVLILDEPAAVLTPWEVDRLFGVIKDVKSKGAGIIYVSHNLEEIKAICDSVAVLRDGVLAGVYRVCDVDFSEMATLMAGRELPQTFPYKDKPGKREEKIVMDVDGLSVEGLLDDVSFNLRKGEILGFFGLAGAGRTELAEALMGLRHRSSGAIVVKDKTVDIGSPSQAMKNGLSYLPEDRHDKGVILDFGIVDNVTLGSLSEYCSNPLFNFVDQDKEYLKAESYVDELDIRATSLYTKLEFFSGGNQQKVSLAKSLDSDPDILILDEPTRGVDVNTRRFMYRYVKKLTDRGLSCIFISSEVNEIIGMCNRVVVMRAGRVQSVLEDDHVNEEEIMFHAAGLESFDQPEKSRILCE